MVNTVEPSWASIDPKVETRTSLAKPAIREFFAPLREKGGSSGFHMGAPLHMKEAQASSYGVEVGAMFVQKV